MNNLTFYLKIICFLILITADCYTQNYWYKLNSPTDKLLNKCIFTDSLNGWAAGDSGTILHTINGGFAWEIRYNYDKLFFTDISFINNNTGWLIGRIEDEFKSVILKTTNSGINWNIQIFSDTNTFYNTITFLDYNTGFVATLGGKIYRTTNAGINWSEQIIDSSGMGGFPINKMKFMNNLTGFACGGTQDFAAMIWKTTNGGMFWTPSLLAYEPLYDIEFLNDQKIVTVGGDFEYGSSFAVSYNTGNNWNFTFLGLFGIAHAIEFLTPSEAWMTLSISGNLARTLDSGNTWSIYSSPDNAVIYDLCFIDKDHGWAVGDSGVILKYQSVNGINNNENNFLPGLVLYQNYPNPFNPITNFKFEIPYTREANFSAGLVNLSVYNSLGQLVKVLINDKLVPGKYEYLWITDNGEYPSGVYYYMLSYNNFTITKKLVLLK